MAIDLEKFWVHPLIGDLRARIADDFVRDIGLADLLDQNIPPRVLSRAIREYGVWIYDELDDYRLATDNERATAIDALRDFLSWSDSIPMEERVGRRLFYEGFVHLKRPELMGGPQDVYKELIDIAIEIEKDQKRSTDARTMKEIINELVDKLNDAMVDPDFFLGPSVLLYPGRRWLNDFSWPLTHIPDFDAIAEASNLYGKTRRQTKSAETRGNDTLLVLIAALAAQAGIAVAARGASKRISDASERIGAPISEDTIRTVIKRIDDAVYKRGK